MGFTDEREAVAAWNRRAQPENKPLTLDELGQLREAQIPIWMGRAKEWIFVASVADAPYAQVWYFNAKGFAQTVLYHHEKFYRSKPKGGSMRLIDADALKKQYYPFPCAIGGERGNDSRNQPPQSPPVVRGEWIEDGDMQICSNCGEEHSWEEYRASYCEDCGAKMESRDISLYTPLRWRRREG